LIEIINVVFSESRLLVEVGADEGCGVVSEVLRIVVELVMLARILLLCDVPLTSIGRDDRSDRQRSLWEDTTTVSDGIKDKLG
jgi:hypothetical protein